MFLIFLIFFSADSHELVQARITQPAVRSRTEVLDVRATYHRMRRRGGRLWVPRKERVALVEMQIALEGYSRVGKSDAANREGETGESYLGKHVIRPRRWPTL